MIFAKKLCFEDMPYQPAVGEIILKQGLTGVNGAHLQGQHLYQRGRYKVQLRAGVPYIASWRPWTPYGISMIVEMHTPFYIDAYLGGSAMQARTVATTNPYTGAGKAQSNKSGYNGQAQSDGIFGGAGGSGQDRGVAWGVGGGNAVGNSPAPGTGSYDAAGSSGSAVWFVPEGKEVGSLKADGTPDAYKCFHCGGHGGTAAGRDYIWGAGGGAYGGGGGGSGYSDNSERGGNGTGGAGGAQFANGAGIGAGRANGQGGLAYYDGEKWVDIFNDMQEGDGLGYLAWAVASPLSLQITYLGGSELSDDYIDVSVNINSGGYDEENERGVKYVGFYWDNEEDFILNDPPNVLLDVSEAGQYQTTLNLVKKGVSVYVLLWGWFNNEQRTSEGDFQKIWTHSFVATDTTPVINVDAVTRQLTLGLNTGPINGLQNSSDADSMYLFFADAQSISIFPAENERLLGKFSIGDTPTQVPALITTQVYGVTKEKLYLYATIPPTLFDMRFKLITEGFQTYLAVEPLSNVVKENTAIYNWTVTYYLQIDDSAGTLDGAVDTVDNGLLTDTIETDTVQGELPEVGTW